MAFKTPPPPPPPGRKEIKVSTEVGFALEMFPILVLCCSTVLVSAAEDLRGDGSRKHFVYAQQARDYHQPPPPPLIIPVPRADIGPVELDYPVKMVQRFTDSDGNVQVVTSYSNRKDNEQPIYRAPQPVPQYHQPVYNPPPNARTSAIEVEARSVPKKQQMSRTKTIRFPEASGQIVDHEEKTSFRDGNAKSFRTESSYDNSYKKPQGAANTRSEETEPRAKYSVEQDGYDDDEYSSAEPEVEDEVAVRSALKKKQVNNKKVVNVPNVSASKPVRRVQSAARSPSKGNDGPIKAAKKADHALEPAGSSFVEDIDDDDDDGYDESDGYGDGHGGVDIHIDSHGIGHEHGGHDHGGHHHHHGHGHDHGHDKKYKKEEGQSYSHGEHFAKGEKGGKGHKSKETYDKGHVEKHGHEHNKGGKKVEEGEKKGHLDEHNSYHKGHSHHKGDKGVEKAHSKGHKKGHKTKGFRTVHHKDEYKKDEVFYDEEHDAGHEKKHGTEHGGHQEVKGGEAKKGHLDSGYKDAVKGVEGEKKEGHSYESAKGHEGHAGHKAAEGHKEGFHKGEGHKAEEAHGHAHESKGKGW